LLLPLFFVFTGLRTEIGLINEPYLWKITGFIILVAVVGKFLGSALAARFVGQSWRNSLTIGALMNTRGLMELIVLNIGLGLGVLTTEVFTMMVIMALVTTFMTGPALDLINYIFKTSDVTDHDDEEDQNKYRILISFGNNEKGKSLLRLAHSLVKKQKDTCSITALHLSLSDEVHSFNVEDKERTSFNPILKEAMILKQEITPIFKTTIDIENEIIDIANQGEYDLLIVGLGKSIFEGTLLGKVIGFTSRIINPERLLDKFTGKEGLFANSPFDERTRQVVSRVKLPLGVLIDKDLKQVNQVFIPIYTPEDSFLIDYAQKLIYNNNATIAFLDINGHMESNFVIASAIGSLKEKFSNNVILNNEILLSDEFLIEQDLMIVSLESWKDLLDFRPMWLSGVPSVLIIKP
jgi:hypothetical protein